MESSRSQGKQQAGQNPVFLSWMALWLAIRWLRVRCGRGNAQYGRGQEARSRC